MCNNKELSEWKKNIEIRILSENEKYYDEILKMLKEADEDFLPPLSSRFSTTQKDFKSAIKSDRGILKYFEEMKKQKIMVALEGGIVLGFVSFKENYINNEIKEDDTPNIYISTLIVKKEARGKGITQSMYESLFRAYETRKIFTRTWSKNDAHIKILSKFNFDILCRLENDRGEGIDTIYFIRKGQES